MSRLLFSSAKGWGTMPHRQGQERFLVTSYWSQSPAVPEERPSRKLCFSILSPVLPNPECGWTSWVAFDSHHRGQKPRPISKSHQLSEFDCCEFSDDYRDPVLFKQSFFSQVCFSFSATFQQKSEPSVQVLVFRNIVCGCTCPCVRL